MSVVVSNCLSMNMELTSPPSSFLHFDRTSEIAVYLLVESCSLYTGFFSPTPIRQPRAI